MGKQQNIPVATSSTSVCTSEHVFSPEYVVLCCTVSILIEFKARAERTPSEGYWFAWEVESLILSEWEELFVKSAVLIQWSCAD